MMNTYDKYKDSGIEWIGKIPEHWNLKKIKHTTYVKGRIGWKGLRSDEFLELSDSYVVTGTDFENGRIKWETCYQVPLDRYEDDPFIKLKNEDLLITKDGTIGKIALVRDMPKIATLNSGVFLTRPYNGEYSQEFMYWILFSEVFKTFYDYNKSGSTIQHLYQNVFNEFEYPYPPPSEQNKIAKYLKHKTTQINTLIAKKEQFINLLQEERTAVINQAVTKGLDPKVKMKYSGIEWLGEIPEHWEVKKLKFISKICNGQDQKAVLDDNGKYPVYGSGGIFGRANSYLFDQPSVLLGRKGTIDKPQYVEEPFWTVDTSYYTKIREGFSVRLFYYLCTTINFELYKYGSAIPSMTQGHLNEIKFSIPKTLKEQKELATYLDKKTNEIDIIISKTKQEIELLKEYKTALISEVVTGKVDVRDIVLN